MCCAAVQSHVCAWSDPLKFKHVRSPFWVIKLFGIIWNIQIQIQIQIQTQGEEVGSANFWLASSRGAAPPNSVQQKVAKQWTSKQASTKTKPPKKKNWGKMVKSGTCRWIIDNCCKNFSKWSNKQKTTTASQMDVALCTMGWSRSIKYRVIKRMTKRQTNE